MRTFLLIMLAGALGTGARYGLTLWIGHASGARFDFPLATLAVNVAGSLLLSLISTLALQRAVSPDLRLILGTGFCGAFTTFSTFGLEADELWKRAPHSAFWYVSANLILGFAAIELGRRVALQLQRVI